MKCIMVATDGSESAHRAIDYAALQAKESGAELLIVNIIGGYGLPGKLLEQFTGAQHVWLKEMLAALSSTTLAQARDRARRVSRPPSDSNPGKVMSPRHCSRSRRSGTRSS